jgi:hypothetical protein
MLIIGINLRATLWKSLYVAIGRIAFDASNENLDLFADMEFALRPRKTIETLDLVGKIANFF